MAKIELATPFDEISGKLSSTERIVMRTRYGRTHAYAIRHPFRGPFTEKQKTVINAFYEAARQCKIEMADPERLAFWQERYAQYTKLAKRNTPKANLQFIGSTSDKYYLTLRGFIIASLSISLRQ